MFLDFHIGVGGGSLLEGHTRFGLVCQLQIRQSHVQVCVLRKGVVFGSHSAEDGGDLRIHAALIIGHSQHVKGIPSMSGRFGIVFYILSEGLYGFVILPEMVFGCTEDTVQLRRVGVAQTVGMG